MRSVPVERRTWRTYAEVAEVFREPADPDWESDQDQIDQDQIDQDQIDQGR